MGGLSWLTSPATQVGHDSSIAVADADLAVMKLKTNLLPLLTVAPGLLLTSPR